MKMTAVMMKKVKRLLAVLSLIALLLAVSYGIFTKNRLEEINQAEETTEVSYENETEG